MAVAVASVTVTVRIRRSPPPVPRYVPELRRPFSAKRRSAALSLSLWDANKRLVEDGNGEGEDVEDDWSVEEGSQRGGGGGGINASSQAVEVTLTGERLEVGGGGVENRVGDATIQIGSYLIYTYRMSTAASLSLWSCLEPGGPQS